MPQRILKRCTLLMVAFAVSTSSICICSEHVPQSQADEEAQALEAQVKQSAEAYNIAVARQEELASEIAKLDARIEELEIKLPLQRERSDESARALYKYKYDTSSMVMTLLDSKSITDMFAIADSYNRIIEHNEAEIRATAQMEASLKESREALAQDKQDADIAASEALSTLESAKAARQRAAERAAQAQIAEASRIQEEILSADASEEEKAAAVEEAVAVAETVSSANVGWSSDKIDFVEEWAPRINAYLAGSAMEGTGRAYAAAAWDNGVDPRWAPAISYVESTMGASCYRSFNAWGYGGINFSSWEEGINRVVSALGGSLYGGYLTREAAATYCPSNPSHWYNSCAAQMANI